MKRRSRIVSFRLSDEEYDSLKNVSATRGARSVSEFTRSVACNQDGEQAKKLEETLLTLTERMELLDRRLQTLTEAVKNAANATTDEEKEEPSE